MATLTAELMPGASNHLVQRWTLSVERFLLQRRLLLGQAMKRAQAPD